MDAHATRCALERLTAAHEIDLLRVTRGRQRRCLLGFETPQGPDGTLTAVIPEPVGDDVVPEVGAIDRPRLSEELSQSCQPAIGRLGREVALDDAQVVIEIRGVRAVEGASRGQAPASRLRRYVFM